MRRSLRRCLADTANLRTSILPEVGGVGCVLEILPEFGRSNICPDQLCDLNIKVVAIPLKMPERRAALNDDAVWRFDAAASTTTKSDSHNGPVATSAIPIRAP